MSKVILEKIKAKVSRLVASGEKVEVTTDRREFPGIENISEVSVKIGKLSINKRVSECSKEGMFWGRIDEHWFVCVGDHGFINLNPKDAAELSHFMWKLLGIAPFEPDNMLTVLEYLDEQ